MKQNEEKQNKELEKNKSPRKNGQYRYTVNNGYMKQNEEKQNKELEKNKRPGKNGQYVHSFLAFRFSLVLCFVSLHSVSCIHC
jgi:hypothetical protein